MFYLADKGAHIIKYQLGNTNWQLSCNYWWYWTRKNITCVSNDWRATSCCWCRCHNQRHCCLCSSDFMDPQCYCELKLVNVLLCYLIIFSLDHYQTSQNTWFCIFFFYYFFINIVSLCQEVPEWCIIFQVIENIIFGSEFEYERYRKAIDVTALEHDINLLPVNIYIELYLIFLSKTIWRKFIFYLIHVLL